MLVVKKELDLQDFMNDYNDILPNDYEANEIIFESLEGLNENGMEDMTIRDYIRFQMKISTQKEIIEDYSIIDENDIKEMEDEEIKEKIIDYLSYNTYFLGSYEDEEGQTVYIYDEF